MAMSEAQEPFWAETDRQRIALKEAERQLAHNSVDLADALGRIAVVFAVGVPASGLMALALWGLGVLVHRIGVILPASLAPLFIGVLLGCALKSCINRETSKGKRFLRDWP
jgi:hypothetical protein